MLGTELHNVADYLVIRYKNDVWLRFIQSPDVRKANA